VHYQGVAVLGGPERMQHRCLQYPGQGDESVVPPAQPDRPGLSPGWRRPASEDRCFGSNLTGQGRVLSLPVPPRAVPATGKSENAHAQVASPGPFFGQLAYRLPPTEDFPQAGSQEWPLAAMSGGGGGIRLYMAGLELADGAV